MPKHKNKKTYKAINKKKSKHIIPVIVFAIILAVILIFIYTNFSDNFGNLFSKPKNIITESGNAKECINFGISRDYFNQGSVQLKYNSNKSNLFGDYCQDSEDLIEYYCNGSSLISEEYSCSLGCNQGACVSPQDLISIFNKTIYSSCKDYYAASPSNAIAQNQFGAYSPLNAIDGDILTRWYSLPENNSAKWIYFDLGNSKCISSLDLYLFKEDLPIDMKLQASNDGIIWTTIKDKFTIKNPAETDIVISSDVVARYIRVFEFSANRSYGTLSDIRVLVSDVF